MQFGAAMMAPASNMPDVLGLAADRSHQFHSKILRRAFERRRLMRESATRMSTLINKHGIDWGSALYTYNLAERMDDVDQIGLRRHHRVDGLVGRWGLVEYLGILTAFNAERCFCVIF